MKDLISFLNTCLYRGFYLRNRFTKNLFKIDNDSTCLATKKKPSMIYASELNNETTLMKMGSYLKLLSLFVILVLIVCFSIVLEHSVFAQPNASEIKSMNGNIEKFHKSGKIVVIEPIFTQAAYTQLGFYSYYHKNCDSRCLTVNIPHNFTGSFTSSRNAVSVLKHNYSIVTDVDVDKNPNILKKYNRVIVLHNEYVTQKEFDAITKHPDVVYLYPNALYAEVIADYNKYTITLIKGHGYPDAGVKNGFDWKFDNSQLEYDLKCKRWSFHNIYNGKMLNCYPENKILFDESLIDAIQEH